MGSKITISQMTFLAYFDGAGGNYLLPVLEPLPRHVFQGDLTHKHGILVLLHLQVLQALQHLQLALWPQHSEKKSFVYNSQHANIR